MNRRNALLLVKVCAVIVACWPIALQANWPSVAYHPPFVIHGNYNLAEHKTLFEDLARLHIEVSQQLKVKPAEEKIDVYLFSDEATYRQYMKLYFPGVTARRAMFIKTRGPGNVFAFRSKNLPVDLRHECTHAILHSSLPMVPLWLDEGLAEYFEAPLAQRQREHEYFRKARWNTRWSMPSMQRLEGIHQLSDMGRNEYREAWSWVHFMLHGPPEAQHELHTFLNDIGRHQVAGDLSQRVYTRIPNIRQAFAQHFRVYSR